MENNSKEPNVFGYKITPDTRSLDNFVHIENYGDETDGYVTKNPIRFTNIGIAKDGHVIEYRLLVSAFFLRDDEEDTTKPYAELILVPEYRSLNKRYKCQTMKIAENDVIKLKSPDIFGKMWCGSIGVCILQQTEDFPEFSDEEDFKNKFLNAFAFVYQNIINDLDLYLDRAREHEDKSYWEELNEYLN